MPIKALVAGSGGTVSNSAPIRLLSVGNGWYIEFNVLNSPTQIPPVLPVSASHLDSFDFIGATYVAEPGSDLVTVNLTAVPEPASFGLLAVGLVFVLRRRRDKPAE